MLYEYAMTPDVFDHRFLDEDGLAAEVLVNVLFEMTKDGQLANLEAGAWIEECKSYLPRIKSPSIRRDCQMLLEQLQKTKRLVVIPRTLQAVPETSDDWLSAALEAHAEVPFDIVFLSEASLSENSRQDAALVHVKNALRCRQWRGRKRSRTVEMTRDGYERALEPMLRHAHVARLVDPFFTPSRGYRNTVELVAKSLGKRGGFQRPGRIEIHTRNLERHSNPQDCLAEWRSSTQQWHEVRRRGHRLDVFLWEKSRPGADRFHNRYIVTDQCAVATNDTLECRRSGHTNWDLLDSDERRMVLESFVTAKCRHSIIDAMGVGRAGSDASASRTGAVGAR